MDLSQLYAEIAQLPDWAGVVAASASARNGYGDTPMHVAAVRGDIVAMRALLAAGGELDASGEHGFTPLHEALAQGDEEAARFLIARGASRTPKDIWGETAVDVAAKAGNPSVITLVRHADA